MSNKEEGFWAGLLTGLLLSGVILVSTSFYAYRQSEQVSVTCYSNSAIIYESTGTLSNGIFTDYETNTEHDLTQLDCIYEYK